VVADHVDVLIVGAGLSGIGAGHQLGQRFPARSYAILEAREEIGGTWSLFRYPGVRSDSDMHTLGFRWRPWTAAKAIADGPAILDYLRDTAREGDVDRHVRLGQRAVRAEWSTADALWTVDVEDVVSGSVSQTTCSFLFLTTGYYRYDEGYSPTFPGMDRFTGQVVHPQLWPEDLDYRGQRVVVIGSGATAVTLVPSMAKDATHVTMLQRSPTYVLALPGTDTLAAKLRRWLPDRLAYGLIRWKNVLRTMASYELSRVAPRTEAKLLRTLAARQLPEGYDVDRHFAPRYDPWDQRLCLAPDGDLFAVLRDGSASVVTDQIATFTETGIDLESGEHLEADLVVTATGLSMLMFGGIELVVGETVEVPERMTYRGVMLSDVPNLMFAFGYTNASWTLKIDLAYTYLWRLLEHLDETGSDWCVPRGDSTVGSLPLLEFQAGYVQRSLQNLPRSGTASPWRLRMNYLTDIASLRRSSLEDGVLEFGTRQFRTPEAVNATSTPGPE
jgi:monooxygenase